MEIYTIQLTTGELLLSKISEFKGNKLYLKNPIAITLRGDENNVQIGFMAYTEFVEGDSIKINRNSVVYCEKADQKLANEYIRRTTGLEIGSGTSSGLITG